MIWWHWFLLGLVFLIVELLAPGGFYLLFFGLSALVVGTIVGLEIVQVQWAAWILFSILSVASLLLFRGRLLTRIKSSQDADLIVDSLVGEVALLLEDIAPGETGKAELRGTTWTVCNVDQIKLVKGQRSYVDHVEGLTLWVKLHRATESRPTAPS